MRRVLAVLLSLSLVLQNIVVVMPVAAQVTASPSAPSGQRPLVDGTANGVPLVNIAPPSAGGVSHNQYNQFNVDQRGLILNNSMKPSDTTLSGWVNGNPHLGSTPARVILNEVVSGNPSQLRGYLEIAGQRAELVVANPNGIHCDGCGFLNASRVMLGTGTPQMNGGNLDRLTPGTGSLSVGTKGLDARTVEQLDLLSREIIVEGDVLAQNLAVIASSNQVLYGTLRILEGTGNTDKSEAKFALDVKALGGMYANQIQMIATDKGLGVNSAGTLAAKQGNLEISANGDIRIHDTFSQQDMILDGPGDVRLTGRTQAEGRLSLEAKGQLINEGELQTGSSAITVTGDFVNSGQINSTSDLRLNSGGSLVNRGKDAVLQAGETLSLTAAQDILNEGALNGGQTATVTAGRDIRNDGVLNSGTTVTATAGRTIRSDGTINSGQTVTATARTGTLTNTGTVSGVTIDATAAGDMTNSGVMAAADRLRLHSGGTFSNTEASQDGGVATLQSGRELSLSVGGDLDNKGVINGQTTTATVTGQMTNSGVVTGTEALSLNIGKSLTNQATTGTSLSRKANAEGKTTLPTLQSEGTLWLETGDGLTNSSTLTAQDVTITSGGPVKNTAAGTINAGRMLTLDSKQSLTNQGLVASDQDMQIDVATGTTNSGTILAVKDLSLNGGGILLNQGTGVIHSDHALSVATQGAVTNKGTISAADMALSTQDKLVNSSLMTGVDRLEVKTAGSLSNTKDGLIRSETVLVLDTGNSVTNQGTISGKDSTLTVAKDINNDVSGLIDGLIAHVKADTLRNTGRIYGDDLTLEARQTTNRDGGVIAARDTLEVGANTLDNLEQGLITSLGDATFRGLSGPSSAMTRLTNGSSRIEAGGNLTIYAALLENRNDHLETYVVVDAPIYHEDILMGGLAHPSYTCGNLGNTSAAWCPGTSAEDYTIRTYLTTYSHTEVSRSEPGEILAGRDMVLRGNVRNTDSHIVAGDALRVSGGTIQNIATKGTNTLTVSHGSETKTEVVYDDWGIDKERDYHYFGGYNPAPVITYSDLHTPRYENNVSDPGLGAAPSPGSFSVAGRDVLVALGQQLKATLDGLVVITSKDTNFEVITHPVKIVLPESRLFQIKTDPVSPYLIETDPTFTNYRNFLSSDYLYNQLKLDPDRTMKHLGDGYYEQRLVQDQIRALTGQDFLGDHRDREEQYRALMEAGARFADEFDLTPGIRLTAEQMAALTEDMVWLVTENVTLPDGRVETVLVPQVYVHQTRTTLAVADNGSLMVGRTVQLEATDSITNSGRIAGQDVALKAGSDIVVDRGTVVGQTTRLEAGQDINVTSGRIEGRETLDLSAGRDVTLATETVRGTNGSNTRDTLGTTTTVTGGDITVQAGRDLTVAGADIAATGDLALKAGRDATITTVTDVSHEVMNSGANHRYEDRTTHQGSTLTAGGTLSVTANDAVKVVGSDLASGKDTTLSGGSVTVAAAVDSHSRDEAQTIKGGQRNSTSHQESAVGGTITAGGNLSVVATETDVTLHGAQLTADGDATLAAARDVTIAALVTENRSTHNSHTDDGLTSKSDSSNHLDQTVNGSSVSGQNVTVVAGLDPKTPGQIAVVGSDLTATGGDVTLAATGDIAVATVEERHVHQESYSKDRGYVLGGGSKQTQDDSLTQQGGTITATGSVTLDSDRGNIAVQAGTITAGEDVTLRASEGMVALLGGEESSYHREASSGSNLVWQQSQDKGESHQTVKLTTITAGGDLTVEAAKGVVVDTRTPLATPEELRANPATAWMAELAGRNDVVWQKVSEAHDHWDYKQQGLSGPAATLISIAISVALGGTNFGLGGTLLGDAANAGLSAGLSALSSQAAIALINNGGDIGKALQELGSADSIRNLATAMITAGLTSGISGALGIGPKDAAEAASRTAEQKLADYVQHQAVSSAVRTLGDVANGKDVGASLRDNLKTLVVTSVSADLFKAIGDLAGVDNLNLSEGSIEKIILHATAGCAIGAAASKDCFAGALGAGLQEALSGVIDGLSADPGKRAQYAGLIASTATFLAGGDSTAIGTANQTANDARAFNRELHRVELERMNKLFDGKSDEEKERIRSAACYIARCSEGVPQDDPNYAQLKAMQEAGAQEQDYVAKLYQVGFIPYEGVNANGDPYSFATIDELSRNYLLHNIIVSGLQVGAGSVGGGSAIAGGVYICGQTGTAGCYVGGALAGLGADYGRQQISDGLGNLVNYQDNWQGHGVLSSLGLAEWSPSQQSQYERVDQLLERVRNTYIDIAIDSALAGVGSAAKALKNAKEASADVVQAIWKSLPAFKASELEIQASIKTLQEASDAIVALEKGTRPDPTAYLSKAYVDNHLKAFEDGAVRIDGGQHRTIGPSDGTFVMPKAEFEQIIRESKGDLRVIEQRLGLETNTLSSDTARIIEIDNPQNLRIPSGNEKGANPYWKPGGYTSGGVREAVVDTPDSLDVKITGVEEWLKKTR